MVNAQPATTQPDRFDGFAPSYSEGVVTNSAQVMKAELVRRYGRSADRVLDVGSADGLHLAVAAEVAHTAFGLDFSAAMLERAQQRLGTATAGGPQLVRSDAARLPFKSASFDLVYSYSTLVLLPSVPGAVREIARVLRPGGIAVLDFAGSGHLSHWLWRLWWRRRGQLSYSTFSRSEALGMLRDAGLEPVEVVGAGLTDYWRFVPLVRRWELARRVLNGEHPDRDLRWSNHPFLQRFAARWYVAAQRGPATAETDRIRGGS